MGVNKEKKCGILTYHFAANYGAVLQCYALKESLNSIGIETSVINYVSNKQRNNNSLYRKGFGIKGTVKNTVLLPFHILRKRRQEKFKAFLDDKVLLKENDIISTLSDLYSNIQNNYYCVISGSDQVFNPKIKDFNTAFFLPFPINARKIGYAVSSGGATVQELLPFKEYIDDFSFITAREKTTIDVLSQITNQPVIEVCDPVFLLNKKEWASIVKPVNIKNYLLCYFVKSTDLKSKIKIAEKIAKEKQLKLIILSARISKYNFTHSVISDAGPIEFVSYFFGADYICTDSFHGTSFSLIFSKPFTTLEKKEEAADGRKINILRKVNALSRVHYLNDKWIEPTDIDYNHVNKKLNEIRQESLAIITSAIKR